MKTTGDGMAAAVAFKDLRVARLDARASVPPVTRPPPPGPLLLGFHRRELSLDDGKCADLRGRVAAAGETGYKCPR
jgi:hypothetical protein